jgi:hypothetical protein
MRAPSDGFPERSSPKVFTPITPGTTAALAAARSSGENAVISILWLTAALIFIPVMIRLAAAMFVRAVVVKTAETIGRQAVEKQPDEIHLMRRGPQVWSDPERASALANALLATGFEDGGTFAVDELPNVYVHLFADRRHSIAANICEHPKAGLWLELVSRYVDGTVATFSTLKPTGLDHRPGFMMVNAPAAEPAALLERALAERPNKALHPVHASDAPQLFEQGYAQSIAWRKQRGVTAAEVVQVAQRNKAAAA